jgi:hypothetical protein
MSLVSSLKKPFSYLYNHKFFSLLLIYSLLITGWSIYNFKRNQDFYNWIMPRHNFFNNFIKGAGYELSREKGFYCVIDNRCNTIAEIGYFSYNNREINFQNDWVKPQEHLFPDYSQVSSSSIIIDPIFNSISSSSISPAKKYPTFYGYIGGDKVKLELKQNDSQYNKIEGNYFSTSENKTYKLSGQINSNYDNQTGYNGGNISMNEFESDSITGKMDINSDKPQGINGGYSYGLSFDTLLNDPAKLNKLFGTYTSTDGIMYDLYLTKDEGEIDNWKTETLTGKLYNNNSNWQSVFIKIGDRFYYSKNVNKFKDLPNESNITFTAKTRASYQGDYYNDKSSNCYGGPGCGQSGGQSGFTSKDLLFGITDVKLADQPKLAPTSNTTTSNSSN